MAPSTMRTNVDAGPDLETLAAYLDGRLSERERSMTAAHRADCETCYFVFTEAAQTRALETAEKTGQAADEPVTATARPSSAAWWNRKILWGSTAGLAAAASLIVAIGTGVIPWKDGDSNELRALVVAVGTDRTIEPRVTGGFA